MDRRELLKLIALATGSVMIGGELVLTACSRSSYEAIGRFTEADIALLDLVADTILPQTDTPGAKEAGVGPFMSVIVTDCYTEQDQNAFYEGVNTLRKEHNFENLTPDQRTEVLKKLDAEAKAYQKPEGGSNHYFTMMKQLTITGYFTSEKGQKEALRYIPVPGKYDGNYPYQKGDRIIVY
jgi:hypothetical protein